ncbi:MAG: hypothetical protein Q7J54_03780 [Candidatus Woesearchaeota archaeon]|nr:hypothetical protein [Candidatus Woesearchaeota archaeon]
MIIRVKKRKNKAGEELSYAYLVENKWTSKGPRQTVRGYLGKVCFFDKKELMFNGNTKNIGYKELIKVLAKWELRKHGFDEKEEVFASNGIFFENNEIYKKQANKKIRCVLAFNEGFLCDFTIKRLLDFNEKGSEKEVGLKLAKCFVEAGIDVPKDVFVECFEKVYEK